MPVTLTKTPALRRVVATFCLAMMIATPVTAHARNPSPVQDGVDGILKDLALEALKKSLGPGGELISNASSFGIDPLVAASTTRGSARDKVDVWLKAMARAGVEAAWPAYGFAVKGGEIVLGSFRGGIEELIQSLQDDQNTAILFGQSDDALLDREDNVMADSPFVQNAGVRGLTAENLGELIPSETTLKEKWDFYIRTLRSLYGVKNANIAANNWPRLLNIWRMQRAAIVLEEFSRRIDREMALAIKQANERAAAGDTGVKDTGPAAQPVPGTFGPPTKKLGKASPPSDTGNQRIAGTMSDRGITVLMESKDPKASSKVVVKWTGDLPPILKPGDVITLKSSVDASRSGPDAPNAWANGYWVVSGNVKILNEKKTFAGMASSGVFTPSDTGEVKFEVLSGGTITIYTRYLGIFWGASDNWTPAEYVYTYTPKR